MEAAAGKSGMDSKTARKYLRDRSFRARCNKSIRGARGQIRSWRRGKRSGNCSLPNRSCSQKRCLSICRERIRGDFRTDRFGLCGAGSSTGGNGGAATRGLLCTGTPAWRAVSVRLHALPKLGHNHRWANLSTSDLSLRSDLLELGNRHCLLFGVVRELERRPAECALVVRWSPVRAPDGPIERRGEQPG